MKKTLSLVFSVLLLLTACSSGPPAPPAADPGPDATGEGPDGSPSARSDKREPRDRPRPKTSGGKGDVEQRERKVQGVQEGEQDGPRQEGGATSLVFPAEGRYILSQDGYEEFCAGASCQREDLPPTQTVDASIRSRSEDSATVETHARISSRRSAKTTMVFRRDKALVTNVTIDFAYGAISFHESYDPKPPIEAALLPLQVGRTWSGSWKADTSGDYSFSVAARETVPVNGRNIEAFRLDSEMVFRGEFRGTSEAQIWVDPSTGFVIKTAGVLDVASDFGTYKSGFLQTLRSGPGY